MESAQNIAELAGDIACSQAFSDAGDGLDGAKVGTTPGLTYRGRSVNGLWGPRIWPWRNTIQINPASDDFTRTVFHEALHEEGYSHNEIYPLAGRPGGAAGPSCYGGIG